MRYLKRVLRESATLGLWMGLALSGWQSALAVSSMPDNLASLVKWTHFVLYSLGGFILLSIVFLIPGIIVALFAGIVMKSWDSAAIRRFLLAGAVGTGLILVVAALRPGLVRQLLLLGDSTRIAVGVAGLVALAYLIGAAISIGALQMLESRPARTQWCVLRGWWVFMVIMPPIAVGGALTNGTPLLTLAIFVPIAAIVLGILAWVLPRTYNSIQRGGVLYRWGEAAGLVLVFLLTWPFPKAPIVGKPATDGSPPVVLITVDTLRPDALGCYPEGDCLRLGTPNIDRLAQEGTVFDAAYVTAPWTVPSVGSILSGLPPSAHGALDDAASVLAPGATTLAEILAEADYATGAVVVNGMLGPGSGMEQGFQTFEEEFLLQREGRRLLFQRLLDRIRLTWPEPLTPNDNPLMERDAVRRSVEFIRVHAGERFFLWLHLFAPHSTWYPPREYRERAERELGVAVPRRDVMRQLLMKSGMTPVTPDVHEGVLALYAGEVAFADDCVGEVVGALRDLEILDDSLVIVTSDHGEEFYEHDRIEHGHSLYPELLRVPLVMRMPGRIPAGERVAQGVSLVDLPPTVLDLAEVEAQIGGSPAVFTGRSLVPLLEGQAPPTVPLFVEAPLYFDRGIQGVILGDLLYIDGLEAVLHPRLYYLGDDPQGRFDILRDRPDDALQLRTVLEDYATLCAGIAEAIGAGEGPSRTEQFRSLGYLN